ncbi:heavy metal-binding domain-containing protein [Ferruginibacter paludis]|uniref:heavy metal-binding domain-containing protein n=1 Tax=Ferruginibacter paludis TaxID=1310417 RepID=UPI0025B5D019|nr:heavy metal-binding domain-containing protein [Ferruginibacter paludis]MDN3654940.1 heavy metal-binding domain-containing protein [Ferruginibacter paludis]
MQSFKMLLMAAFTILSVNLFAQEVKLDSSKKHLHKDVQKAMYTCSMHPEVMSDKPGKCPKCGMDLVKVKKEKSKPMAMKMYSCPMHPEVTSDKPGKCSKCGMALVEKKEDHSKHQH